MRYSISILLIFMTISTSIFSQNILTINNGTTIKVTNNSNIHLKNTKFNNNGTFDAGNGTVVIEGDAATALTSIAGTNQTTFYNLTINKSTNDAALMQTITVSNQLNLTSGKLEIANNDLMMGDAASFANINKDRYIKTNGTGTLKRKVSNTFVPFPVGKATFNPARLKNDGTVDVFSVRVIDNFYQNGTSGNQITNNVVPKTWLISENTPGGSDVTMRLVWRPSHGGAGFDANTSQITHYENGKWNDLGTAGTATSDNSYNSDHKYQQASGITSFSPFGAKSNGANLPVELLYFYGEKQDENVQLSWQTATELNNSHFDVEWSKDGTNFEKIGEVAGAGTTNDIQFYDFLHLSPIQGQNYYRLRQVDLDGKFEYTNIIQVEFNGEPQVTINVFPNPATDYLKIQSNQNQLMQMFDVNGRLIVEQQISTYENIDISQLASGTYFVKVGQTIKKIIVQK